MALLAEDERMLKKMLMELNERCEDYGTKINISKTKAMVIGRKPKKTHIRIKGESTEQVDSLKYLGCNINSNMNCCQEVKQRIAMAKEAFNRKRSIFCRPLEKELRKRLVKCFVWSVVLYGAETCTLRWNEKKLLSACDKIKNAVVLGRVGKGRIMLELIKKRKRNCLLKDALEGMVNGKKVRCRRRYIIDNIMINELYEGTKRKAEKRVEWRMLSLQ